MVGPKGPTKRKKRESIQRHLCRWRRLRRTDNLVYSSARRLFTSNSIALRELGLTQARQILRSVEFKVQRTSRHDAMISS